MAYKSITLAILVAAISFGALIAGCNRDRGRTAMASRRNQGRQARPAEVLSASAYRPQAREYAVMPAMAQSQPGPVYTAAPVPVHAPAPVVYRTQPAIIHPTPDLVMAQASMPPPPTAWRSAGFESTMIGYAPIPELEPARRRPVVALAPMPAPGMIANARFQGERQEIQRALAPLPQTRSALQPLQPLQLTQRGGWVSSPATAMRTY